MGKKREEAMAEETNVNECATCEEKQDCTEAPAVPEGAATEKPKKEKKVGAPAVDSTYKFNPERAAVEGEKALPKQAAQIIDIIAAAGEAGVKRSALLEAMSDVITTVQPIERILGFYQPRLVDGGYITVTK